MSGGFPSMNRAVAAVPDFTDTFDASTGWTLASGHSIGSGVFTINGDPGLDSYKSLGFTLSDTVWTHDLDFKPVSESGAKATMGWALSDNNSPESGDSIGSRNDTNSLNVAQQAWNGGSNAGETGGITEVANTQYYVRQTRNSSTSIKLQYFSDSDRTSQVGSDIDTTIASTIVGLDRIVFGGWQTGASANRVYDNVNIYDGVDLTA
jgi:hypothetical protein